jgi:hypothetical protein
MWLQLVFQVPRWLWLPLELYFWKYFLQCRWKCSFLYLKLLILHIKWMGKCFRVKSSPMCLRLFPRRILHWGQQLLCFFMPNIWNICCLPISDFCRCVHRQLPRWTLVRWRWSKEMYKSMSTTWLQWKRCLFNGWQSLHFWIQLRRFLHSYWNGIRCLQLWFNLPILFHYLPTKPPNFSQWRKQFN